ncbi:TetR/AcrR family transcriptional regulator [Desulfallas sp. Bu1-1]|uniref:TetR/AcrR family transcriptional regulator n=1 Tax=Desulfallas sp. Bu1-1 TaxID=2787620 RepID=UPI0018A0FB47|nr:TetR/AcrR family transcriptional regulator [Desulfallas sp. Bu1-1]MBF7082860.1 TetR/AcrR family transcriptional regulator [Desulfallas sp. Bu1-1]
MTAIKDNPTRIERRKEQIRERIIKAALQAFDEYGYAKTTVDDITTRADIGHGTFYQYFKSKQDLLVMMADDLAERLDDYVRPKNKHLSVYERMNYEARGILNFYVKHRSLLAALKEAMMIERQFEEKWKKITNSLFRRIERDIKGSMQKGYCRNVDVDVAIRAFTFMLEGYAHYVMMEIPGSVDIDATADSLTDLVYHAIFKVQN